MRNVAAIAITTTNPGHDKGSITLRYIPRIPAPSTFAASTSSDLKKEDLGIIFVTHDIAQAYYISDKVLIFKNGEIVKKGLAEEVFTNPKHPYTKELLASVPSLYEKWEI
jgi:hypothetical protein